jgi:thiamine-phosphate pyrophosphorylase
MQVLFPAIYAILDPHLASSPLVHLAQMLAKAGVRLMQLRDKRSSTRRIYLQACELAATLQPMDVRFIVNDRPDIAIMSRAEGVHVGQNDLPVEEARRICGRPRWVGVSTHSLEQLREADRTSADYIAVGPIFPTGTKENPDPVVGIDFLRRVRPMTRKPLVAIGGITLESAAAIFRAGADSVALARDLLAAPDPGARAQQYLAVAEQARIERH